jgi:hypothetical protein
MEDVWNVHPVCAHEFVISLVSLSAGRAVRGSERTRRAAEVGMSFALGHRQLTGAANRFRERATRFIAFMSRSSNRAASGNGMSIFSGVRNELTATTMQLRWWQCVQLCADVVPLHDLRGNAPS